MEIMAISGEPRTKIGSRSSRKLREQGLIPGVVYGHKVASEPITIKLETIEKVLKEHARTFNLQCNGSSQQVIIKELQWDHLGAEVVHVDFQRVSAGERVEVEIPIQFKGDISPNQKGVFQHPMQSLTVECSATDQPESIMVEISHLTVGDSIHVRDLVLPEGVKAVAPEDAIVAILVTPAGIAAEDEETEGVAEPERVGGAKPKDEEE